MPWPSASPQHALAIKNTTEMRCLQCASCVALGLCSGQQSERCLSKHTIIFNYPSTEAKQKPSQVVLNNMAHKFYEPCCMAQCCATQPPFTEQPSTRQPRTHIAFADVLHLPSQKACHISLTSTIKMVSVGLDKSLITMPLPLNFKQMAALVIEGVCVSGLSRLV